MPDDGGPDSERPDDGGDDAGDGAMTVDTSVPEPAPEPEPDLCPADPLKMARGICGCGVADVDTDGDDALDCEDACPNDPNKIVAGACDCGTADTNADGDAQPDCHDECINDPAKIVRGACPCGTPNTDSDSDGSADCVDACDNDRLKVAPGMCGCGALDTDSDSDGTANCNDQCPSRPARATRDATCGCGVTATQPYCSALPYLPGAPVIDGVLECGLPLTTVAPEGWNGSSALPAGNSARFAAAWRPNGLYVFIDVTDPELRPAPAGAPNYCGDAVDFYFDADGVMGTFHDWPGAGQVVVRAPSPAPAADSERRASVHTHTGENEWNARGEWTETSSFIARRRTGGYSVEALITGPAVGLSPLSLANRIGMSVGVMVSHPTNTYSDSGCPGSVSNRMGQYYLRIGALRPASCPGGDPWCTSSAFCSPSLTPEPAP